MPWSHLLLTRFSDMMLVGNLQALLHVNPHTHTHLVHLRTYLALSLISMR
jgi:hypothetical protein